MVVALRFSSTTIGAASCDNLVNKSCQRQKTQIKTVHVKNVVESINSRRSFTTKAANPKSDASPSSHAQIITKFYSAINYKNLKRLDGLIAEDCTFEDYSFAKPFQGKEEVMSFLEQLVLCMGQNMQFNVDHICEGNDHTAAVNWHIDWNKIPVPFTRGCSCYSFSVEKNELVIEKAQVLVEPPIKLGAFALTAFKIVSYTFDAFPQATKWLLTSQHVLFRLLLKASNIFIKSISGRLLAWHIRLLSASASIFSAAMALRILFYLSKIYRS